MKYVWYHKSTDTIYITTTLKEYSIYKNLMHITDDGEWVMGCELMGEL